MAESKYSRERASQFQLRFSDDLHARIKAEAARNERPINAEIIYRLERSLEPSGTLHADLAGIINKHIEAEVQARLRRVAASLGSGS